MPGGSDQTPLMFPLLSIFPLNVPVTWPFRYSLKRNVLFLVMEPLSFRISLCVFMTVPVTILPT